MTSIQSIHPFPARMAPEIALDEVKSLAANSLILDPMVGSGTVVRAASDGGHRAIGFDMDPLAVLMSRVWTTPVDTQKVQLEAIEMLREADTIDPDNIKLPWIDDDEETQNFVNRWFAEEQQYDLRRLSSVLHKREDAIADVLRIALSRIIITKNRGHP